MGATIAIIVDVGGDVLKPRYILVAYIRPVHVCDEAIKILLVIAECGYLVPLLECEGRHLTRAQGLRLCSRARRYENLTDALCCMRQPFS